MLKRTAKVIFWLTLVSAASQHNILLGLVLYPIAAFTVVLVFFSPVILACAAGVLWYWLRHRRLPAWLVGITPRRLRRRLRRRAPRPPRPHEARTEEMPVVPVPGGTTAASGAAALAGQAATSHLP